MNTRLDIEVEDAQRQLGAKHAVRYHELRDTGAAPKLRAKFQAALQAYKADGEQRPYLAGWLDVMGRRVRSSAGKEA